MSLKGPMKSGPDTLPLSHKIPPHLPQSNNLLHTSPEVYHPTGHGSQGHQGVTLVVRSESNRPISHLSRDPPRPRPTIVYPDQDPPSHSDRDQDPVYPPGFYP